MNPKILIVGCGDIGYRVAQRELASKALFALCRSNQSAEKALHEDLEPIRGDLDGDLNLDQLPNTLSGIYYFAPPPNRGVLDSRMTHFLKKLEGLQIAKFIYISTTGVYGDCEGRWIDESEPTLPLTDRGKRRLDAELQLQRCSDTKNVGCSILRVPGIYGPGRLPIERIKNRVPVVRIEEAPYSNRIHSEDLAEICYQAMNKREAVGIYNVSDGHPTSMTDYFLKVADCLGLERPPQISMEEARKRFTPEMLSFLDESKRISNQKLLNDLKFTLKYPDLSQGLKHSI